MRHQAAHVARMTGSWRDLRLRMASLLLGLTAITRVEGAGPELPALAALAQRADLVAVVQVLDTDYEYAREFPVGGTAFLRVLIPYKVSRPLEDVIEVYEEGLHPGECYFTNPPAGEEGRRFLVLLRFNPEVAGQYRGLAEGCALEVLVTRANRYALRYPAEGIALADDFRPLAGAMDFADAYATLPADGIGPTERDALLRDGFLARHGDGFIYTQGIELAAVRQLLGTDNLTRDRALKR